MQLGNLGEELQREHKCWHLVSSQKLLSHLFKNGSSECIFSVNTRILAQTQYCGHSPQWHSEWMLVAASSCRACTLKYCSKWCKMNAEHAAIVTFTKLPNQPPPAFSLPLFTFTHYLCDNSSWLRDTIWDKLPLWLYQPIWSFSERKQHAIWDFPPTGGRADSPINPHFIQWLYFP